MTSEWTKEQREAAREIVDEWLAKPYLTAENYEANMPITRVCAAIAKHAALFCDSMYGEAVKERADWQRRAWDARIECVALKKERDALRAKLEAAGKEPRRVTVSMDVPYPWRLESLTLRPSEIAPPPPPAIKPCPFCGRTARALVWKPEGHFVSCMECGMRTGDHRTPEEAITTWNRRALPRAEAR